MQRACFQVSCLLQLCVIPICRFTTLSEQVHQRFLSGLTVAQVRMILLFKDLYRFKRPSTEVFFLFLGQQVDAYLSKSANHLQANHNGTSCLPIESM